MQRGGEYGRRRRWGRRRKDPLYFFLIKVRQYRRLFLMYFLFLLLPNLPFLVGFIVPLLLYIAAEIYPYLSPGRTPPPPPPFEGCDKNTITRLRK